MPRAYKPMPPLDGWRAQTYPPAMHREDDWQGSGGHVVRMVGGPLSDQLVALPDGHVAAYRVMKPYTPGLGRPSDDDKLHYLDGLYRPQFIKGFLVKDIEGYDVWKFDGWTATDA